MRNRSREETDVGKPRTGFQYQATTAMNMGYSQKVLLVLYTKSSSNTKIQNGLEKNATAESNALEGYKRSWS